MKKYLFLTLLFLVFFPNNAKAECSDSETIRLQKLARNVNVTYIYNQKSDTFTVTFTNLKKELVLYDTDYMEEYKIEGEKTFYNLHSGQHEYMIYASDRECMEDELTTKHVTLPYRNNFYNYKECEGINNYSYCKKWVNNQLSYDIWLKKVTEYKKNLSEEKTEKKQEQGILYEMYKVVSKYYSKYYYIILPSVILLLGIVILIKNRKDSLV